MFINKKIAKFTERIINSFLSDGSKIDTIIPLYIPYGLSQLHFNSKYQLQSLSKDTSFAFINHHIKKEKTRYRHMQGLNEYILMIRVEVLVLSVETYLVSVAFSSSTRPTKLNCL